MSTPPVPPCSKCGGAHHWGLTHKHTTDCPRYEPETATTNADFDRGEGIREATTTELEIINEHEYETPGPDERFFVRFEHYGLHWRVVHVGTDSDTAREVERPADDDTDDGD